MGRAFISISISMLTFSMFKAHRLRFRLSSVWMLGLMPPSFFLGRMEEVEGVGPLPPALPGPTEAGCGEAGEVTCTGDRAARGNIDSSPEKNFVLLCPLSENTACSL